MNCLDCQRQLLACDDPASQSLEVAAHLADCLACQEWHQHLLRIESNVPRLPVPPSRGAEKIKRLILNPTPNLAPTPAPDLTPAPSLPIPSRWHSAAYIAAGMAAAILLTFLGIQLGNLATRQPLKNGILTKHSPPVPETPPKGDPQVENIPQKSLAAVVLEFDLQLAQTDDPRQRVEILADLAGVLHDESRTLTRAGGTKELQTLARLYDRVLQDGVLARAKDLPMADRRATLDPIAQRLELAQHDSVRLAAAAEARLSAPLQQIAAAAQRGTGLLRKLMDEVSP